MTGASVTGQLLQEGGAERRLVTILFADLAGYTAFCQERDPEAVHLLVRPLMSGLRRVCEDAGALVPGVAGDGFMAVFGARHTREDDAATALEVAIRLQRLVAERQELVPELPGLHVGLHMGEVLVAGLEEEPELTGDAVNVASRLATSSRAGEVLVSADTVPLTRCQQGWSDPEELVLRGRTGTFQARRLDWRSVIPGSRAPRWGHESAYVDRPRLERALGDALERGGALVVGEAGVGKSRLAVEALRSRPSRTVSCSRLRHPTAQDLVAVLLDGVDGAGDLASLLRTGPPGPRDHEALVSLLEAAGRRLAAEAPGCVFHLDDAESLPPDEVSLLASVVTGGNPWVVCSRRPLPGLPLVRVDVAELGDDERDALVGHLLPGASDSVRDVLVQRAGGRPLFLEQCARLMRETGAVRVGVAGTELVEPDRLRQVPTSMRLFVSSRLDLLERPLREVLDVAAVLGDVPELALLQHLTQDDGSRVEQLVGRGLLRWEHGNPLPVLRFAHALVRDVAYETMLRAERARLHLLAAEWYAVLPVSQELEAQAVHLEAAVVHGGADCETVRRAVRTMTLFARSIETERSRVAADTLRRARELALQRAECGPDTLLLELATASVCMIEGREHEAADAARRALGMATEAGDTAALAEAHLHLGRATMESARASAVLDLEQAERGFLEVGDPASQARVVLARSLYTIQEKGLAQQVAALESAYDLALRSGDARLQATTAQELAMHAGFAHGRRAFEAWSAKARAVSRSDDAGLEPRLAATRAWLASCEMAPAKGLEDARAALVAGRDLGLHHVYVNALVTYLELALIAGEVELGTELLEQARAHAATRPDSHRALQVELCAASFQQRAGDAAAAARTVGEVASHPDAQDAAMQHDIEETRAWLALERGAFAEARAHGARAALLSEDMSDTCLALRPRYFDLVAAVCGDLPLALSDIRALRAGAHDTGLETLAHLSARWLNVSELGRGWAVDDHNVGTADTVEGRALDLEIEALSQRAWDRLLAAAAVWGELGTTVWQARALLWHSELTGADHPEADRLLEVLQSPAGLAERLRAQVRGLRA